MVRTLKTENTGFMLSRPTENKPIIRSRALPDCNLQEVRSLKAFIAYDAIVDPEHPLAIDDGGMKAYLGTTQSCRPLRRWFSKIF